LTKRLVDDVAEVRLKADVDEANHGEDLVDHGLADGVGKAGGEEEVLDGLEELHREEEEDTRREHGVAGAGVNPPRRKKANGGESAGHVSVEAHFLFFLCFKVLEILFVKKRSTFSFFRKMFENFYLKSDQGLSTGKQHLKF
jgi:hypothetical protein